MKHLLKLTAATTCAALALTTASVTASITTANAQSSGEAQKLADGVHHAATTPADSFFHGYDPFYDDPVDNLGTPGTLLRTQPAPHLLNILGPDFPGYAEKILYTSTTVHGDPVATSGFVIEPANPWQGNGPTPTVIFAPGTRGAGDMCAPSRGPWLTAQLDAAQPALGVNYELVFYEAAALAGMRVVVVDYIGLGTPGAHTYVLHDEEGHAMLDAARAVVPAGSPVAFYGYSQGGGASAAAAELQPTYAPELNVKGTFAGAPPADLMEVVKGVDTSTITSVLGYAANGYLARYPELGAVLDTKLNDRGWEFLNGTKDSCMVDDALTRHFTSTSDLTSTGESLYEIVNSLPHIKQLFVDQKLGETAPTSPIMVSTGGNDDLVPTPQVVQLARDYCALGVTTTMFNENIPPLTPGTKFGVNHAAGIITQSPTSFRWIMDRFNGVPAGSNCGTF